MSSFKFKTEFARDIFRNKYAQGPDDSWPNLCRRLVSDVCGDRSLTVKPLTHPLMSRDDQAQLVQYMIDMKFIPGGRYLYYAGRPASFFNNCFSHDTRFMTDKGIVSFKHVEGQVVNILSPVTGTYLPAQVKSYGVQDINEVEFTTLRGKQNTLHKVSVTPNHRWFLMDGSVTTNLKVGDMVKVSSPSIDTNTEAFIHGLVFADGNVHHLKKHYGHQLRLCGTKNRFVELFDDSIITYPEFANGDACIYMRSDVNLKELPQTTDINYIANFILGWLAGDGHSDRILHTTSKEAIRYFIEYSAYAGYVITGELKCETKPSNYGERKPLYYIRFQSAEDFLGYKVKSIIPSSYIGKVYCVEEPQHHAFTLAGGIATSNCFVFIAEEDSREEWASIAERTTSALMSGGGIGVDYSILRPSGRTLSRTGGISSGPIPLMHIVNEIGRNVMQGGSRRSAMLASLNWQHDDIHAFLAAKDWDEEMRTIKAKNFDFPLPLDMTNISVNYDTDFIANHARAKFGGWDAPDIWYQNVKQMCQTGEPGMCFNFYENEKDTGRNACAEFTSSEDSDVCNLGSINLGNIYSLDELRDVVSLASKFLVCGTIRGELPFEKVRKVREENRKIGLGLMGVHEWLLQRGYKYEVNDELKSWLEVYKDESERAAKEHCDRFYIQHPKKYRAVAPAGTIGILA